MNYYQERKLNMYLLLQQFITDTPPEVLAAMPNFSSLFTDFNAKVGVLNENSGRQQLQRGGNLVQKAVVRERVAMTGSIIASKVMAYASNVGNDVLFEEVNYPKSSLTSCSETLFVTRCAIIHDKALAHLADLATYAIDNKMLDDFNKDYLLFDSMIPRPQQGVVTKKIATQALRTNFKDSAILLDKMTLLTKMLVESHPDFYRDFTASKRLTAPAYRTLGARGAVVDSNGNRIALVTIACVALGIKHKISKSGGFYLRNLPDGIYPFTFSRAGYVTVTQDITFYRGTREEVLVVMASM